MHWTVYAGLAIPAVGLLIGGVKWCVAMYVALQRIEDALKNLVDDEKKNAERLEEHNDILQNHEVRLTLVEKRA